jgi:hypothetical protein
MTYDFDCTLPDAFLEPILEHGYLEGEELITQTIVVPFHASVDEALGLLGESAQIIQGQAAQQITRMERGDYTDWLHTSCVASGREGT